MVAMNGLLKSGLAVVVVAGYALTSHLALTLPGGKTLAAVLAVGIPSVVVVAWAFQWVFHRLGNRDDKPLHAIVRAGLAGFIAAVPVLAFLYLTWPLMLANTEAVYFAQHVGTNGLLAWVFGRTLAEGLTPLIVTFAKMIHPTLPREIESYARKVTVAWTWFFVMTCVISVVLYVAGPLYAWSAFALLLQWPSVAVFFIGEYLLRKKLFKTFDHATLKQGFDAYRQSQNSVSSTNGEKIQ